MHPNLCTVRTAQREDQDAYDNVFARAQYKHLEFKLRARLDNYNVCDVRHTRHRGGPVFGF